MATVLVGSRLCVLLDSTRLLSTGTVAIKNLQQPTTTTLLDCVSFFFLVNPIPVLLLAPCLIHHRSLSSCPLHFGPHDPASSSSCSIFASLDSNLCLPTWDPMYVLTYTLRLCMVWHASIPTTCCL